MIFPKYKLLFLHSGKTAGSAIEKMIHPDVVNMPYNQFNDEYFYGGNGQVLTQHASAQYMKDQLPTHIWEDYHKFTVVRNPYERLYSVFNYTHDQHEKQFGTFKKFIMSLPELLNNPGLHKGSHYLPQWDYASICNHKVVDTVLNFESLAYDINAFRKTHGIENEFEKYNLYTNPRRDKSKLSIEHYDCEMIQVMNSVYADDFINFGYNMRICSLKTRELI